MIRAQWNKIASKYAEHELCCGDLWDENDPYSLHEVADDAFQKDQDPKAFVREMFTEDFAKQEHDAEQYRESIEAEFGEDR